MYFERGCNVLSQSFDLFQTFELKIVLNAFFRSVVGDPEKVLLYNFDFGYWKADTHEWIESN
jgi:hypothetical protein